MHVGHFFVRGTLYFSLTTSHFHQPSLFVRHYIIPTYYSSIPLLDGDVAIKRWLIVLLAPQLHPPQLEGLQPAGLEMASFPTSSTPLGKPLESSRAKGQSADSKRSVKPPSEINLWNSQARGTVAQDDSSSHRQIQSGNSKVFSDKSKTCQDLLKHSHDTITNTSKMLETCC